jgi:hypothetical protein
MLHTNVWKPDTCDCEIEFEFDDAVPAESRVHTSKRIIKACSVHNTVDIADKHDHFSTVLGENQRKNKLHGEIMEQFPELVDLDENGGKRLKEGINYKFTFEGEGKNRTLNVELEGADLKAADKKKIKDTSDGMFGNGKVVVK